MLDFVIIANPASGSRAAPRLATRARELLQAAGRAVELQVTAAQGDARRFAAEAAAQGVQTVVGCGGDGTLQEIATALDGSRSALGILPGGRCNDFARALGLRPSDPPEALARMLLGGRRRTLDLGAYHPLAAGAPGSGDKRFLTVATLGFDSEVSRFVEIHKLWLKGTPAYVYGVLRVLTRFHAPLVRLKGDFGTHEERVLLVATGNTPSYGGALHITPGARLDDGLFQLCVVKDVSAFTVLRILPRVLKGTHTGHPAVSMLTTRSLEIETPEGPQWVCADGESLGQTPCKLEVRPHALQVVIPGP
ncbi:MAG: diacylglycerol kinase family lipid kinase [Planctomycetota bacterium]|nr:diacylglycerol kinase family lipid kinase [Planctomycetota bacterium]